MAVRPGSDIGARGAAENCQKPNHSAENSGECAGLLGGKVQLFVEIVGEGGKCAVVGEALEDFRDVGDPEGTVEAGSYLVETLAETHSPSGWKRSDCTGER